MFVTPTLSVAVTRTRDPSVDQGNNVIGREIMLTLGAIVSATTSKLIDCVWLPPRPSRTLNEAARAPSGVSSAVCQRTEFEYDLSGRVIRTLFPDGTQTDTAYDATGNVVSTTDQAGNVTRYVTDEVGRRIAIIFADMTPVNPNDNPRETYEYDAAGRESARIDPRGNRTETVYDSIGRVIDVIDALGNHSRTQYDAAGQVASYIDPRGFVTTFEYDVAGRQTAIHLPNGSMASQGYDALGRDVLDTDPLGNSTHYSFDHLGRLISVADPEGHVTSYGYDELGNQVRQTDANNHMTRFEFDVLGNTTATIRPNGDRSTNKYDAVGNVTSTIDFNGNQNRFDYDAMNRVVTQHYADRSNVTFTYTPTGQRATVSDERGTTTYQYDERNRLTRRTDPDGQAISYDYDVAGNTVVVTTLAGTDTTTYDALNRIASVTSRDGVTRFTYDATGDRTGISYPNGTTETVNYDSVGRIATQQTHNAGGVLLSRVAYSYDVAGHRISSLDDTGRAVAYQYDAAGRLTREQVTDAMAGNRTTDYVYDPVGNRLRRIDNIEGVTNETFDVNDRLTSETHGTTTTIYTTDANGNVLSVSNGPNDRTVYGYDSANRLVSAVVTASGKTTHYLYAYNADGTRISRTVEGKQTRFLVDENRHLSVVLAEYTPDGTTSIIYVYADSLVSQTKNGTTLYFHAGTLGTTRLLTDANGLVASRFTYDAFGRVLSPTGPLLTDYLFIGEPLESGLGLSYFRARYYNPTTGRFHSTDPEVGSLRSPISLHRFLYASGDPVNNFDPSGTLSILEALVVFVVIYTIVNASVDYLGGRYSHVANQDRVLEFESQIYLYVDRKLKNNKRLLESFRKAFGQDQDYATLSTVGKQFASITEQTLIDSKKLARDEIITNKSATERKHLRNVLNYSVHVLLITYHDDNLTTYWDEFERNYRGPIKTKHGEKLDDAVLNDFRFNYDYEKG